MISKLRKKIIAINVISVCIVFFVAIVITFTSGFSRIEEERTARLNSMLDYDDWHDAEMVVYKSTVLVEYDLANKRIVNKKVAPEVDLDESQFEDMVSEIAEKKSDDGWMGTKIQYVKKTTDDGTVRIVLYDRYSGASKVQLYVAFTLLSLVIGALCYFAISWFLARFALNPVEESWNKQKQFVADASHELKTPLSVIMANTEIIASHADETVESQMKWIENTRAESQRMAELVNDLLFLAKNDDGVKAQMQLVNLSECIETIVLTHEAVFYENGKVFNYEIAPDLQVLGSVGQLKQLATILLDNANKYSVDSGNIALNMTSVGKHAVFTVSNDCEALTDEQLKHLFDRFYTVDQSRNKSSAGNGLGLSIAQIICKSHGGDISVGYDSGRITFTATLPISKLKQ